MVEDDRRDAGFTLVEVIVASVLFVILGTTVAVALTTAIRAAAASEGRVQATNLAAEQIELARDADPSTLADASVEVQRGKMTYHVTTTVDSQTADVGGSACDGASGAEALKRVTVTVTWDGMGDVAPVRSDTYRNLPITGSSSTRGTLTLKVVDRESRPLAGSPVALSRDGVALATRATGADGCVAFSNLEAGAGYRAELRQSGFVDPRHAPTTAVVTTVVAKQVTKHPGFQWDRASTPVITAPVPAGYPVPAGVPVTLFNGDAQGAPLVLAACSSTSTVCADQSGAGSDRATWNVQGLFPRTSGYRAAAGGCGNCTASPRTVATIQPLPGQPTPVNVPGLGGLDIVLKKGGRAVAGSVWVVNVNDPNEKYQLTGITTSGPGRIAVPAGSWRVSVSATEANATYRTSVDVGPLTTRAIEVTAP